MLHGCKLFSLLSEVTLSLFLEFVELLDFLRSVHDSLLHESYFAIEDVEVRGCLYSHIRKIGE